MKPDPSSYLNTMSDKLKNAISCAYHAILEALMPKTTYKVRMDFLSNLFPEIFKLSKLQTALKIGQTVGSLCKETERPNKPKKRRPLMAIATEVVSRTEMESFMNGGKISKYEWTEASLHAKYPGPGKPVMKKHFSRIKVSESKLDHLLSWIARSSFTQDLAFGHKTYVYDNGMHIPISSVKRTAHTNLIIRRYCKEFIQSEIPNDQDYVLVDSDHGEDDSDNDSIGRNASITTDNDEIIDEEDIRSSKNEEPSNLYCQEYNGDGDNAGKSLSEDVEALLCRNIEAMNLNSIPEKTNSKVQERCKHIHKKYKTRCLRPIHAPGTRHKFTTKEYLSPSSINTVLKSITSGTIKSLHGLDNIDVEKGDENFDRMKKLVSYFLNISNHTSSEEKQEQVTSLNAEIDDVKNFHKTDFHRHLDLKLKGDKAPICTCIRCGLTKNHNESICPCKLDHSDPCGVVRKNVVN